jgi:hypothetical protein
VKSLVDDIIMQIVADSGPSEKDLLVEIRDAFTK